MRCDKHMSLKTLEAEQAVFCDGQQYLDPLDFMKSKIKISTNNIIKYKKLNNQLVDELNEKGATEVKLGNKSYALTLQPFELDLFLDSL